MNNIINNKIHVILVALVNIVIIHVYQIILYLSINTRVKNKVLVLVNNALKMDNAMVFIQELKLKKDIGGN